MMKQIYVWILLPRAWDLLPLTLYFMLNNQCKQMVKINHEKLTMPACNGNNNEDEILFISNTNPDLQNQED